MPVTTTGRATDFITFTRASGATVVDANGAIKWAGHNLVLNSGAPATQTLTVEVGRVYTVECTGTGSVTLSGAGTGTVSAGTPRTVTASTTSLVLTVSGSVTTMWAYRSGLGGMVLNPATGTTYYPTTGSIYNAPRLDYDPVTLAPRGLLVEEQRSNLLVRSAEFDNATWIKANITMTANSTVSPAGTTDADTVAGTTAGTVNYILQSVVATATVYTYSIWVMAGTATTCVLLLRDGTAASNFTVTASVLSGPGSVSGTTTVTVSGLSTTQWTRVAITTTAAATAGNTVQAWFYPETSSLSTTAKSTIVWGAQLEAGSFATSYIPTLAASATRSADVASVATSSFPYNQAEGTIVVNGQFNGIGTNPMMVSLYTGSGSSDYTLLYVTTASNRFDARFANAGSSQGSISYTAAGTPTINTTYKGAIAYKQDDFAMTVNGNTIATDTVGNVPPAADTMKLGVNPGNGQSINGYIRQITYIPRRLTNAELVTRTT